jgi:hypothetical protein
MYALAATAAGVGVLIFAQPAEAKIVYTPANVRITPINGSYNLDLNHDGKTDFFFSDGAQCHGSTCQAYLVVFPVAAGNEMWGQHSSASDLRAGVRIGPRGRFSSRAGEMAFWGGGGFHCPWANGGKGVKNRYLGLEFQINGKTHFGWARLNVQWNQGFIATLTGYAYETVANRSIVTGKTKGPDEVSSVDQANGAAFNVHTQKSATLGVLAMGAPGLSIWRREEQPATAQ